MLIILSHRDGPMQSLFMSRDTSPFLCCIHQPLSPMSQKPISNSVARLNIRTRSSIRLGETLRMCSSSNATRIQRSQSVIAHFPWVLVEARRKRKTYHTQSAPHPRNPPPHSSQSTSSRDCPCAWWFSRRGTSAWRWRRSRSGTVPERLVAPASLRIGRCRGCIGCRRRML